MSKMIVSGSAIAVAVAGLLIGDAAQAAVTKQYQASKAKASTPPAASQKHKCNTNGCPTPGK